MLWVVAVRSAHGDTLRVTSREEEPAQTVRQWLKNTRKERERRNKRKHLTVGMHSRGTFEEEGRGEEINRNDYSTDGKGKGNERTSYLRNDERMRRPMKEGVVKRSAVR